MRQGLLFLLLLFIASGKTEGQAAHALFDSLYHTTGLHLTLTYPYDSLTKTRRDELEARLTITSDRGVILQDEPLTIQIRGKFRRMVCTMPPLQLNFKKSMLRKMGFSEADEMKLVTHCIKGEEGLENLEEEHLCYQLYASLTEYAYRTIWVTMDYCDALHPGTCSTSVGMLLEPDHVLEERLGLTERKLYNLAEDSLHYESYSRLAAFNFMVGNRDWSIVSSRNAKLFYHPEMKKYVVIPYDFDYANLVAASYRKQTMPAGMNHPFDRIYEGEYFPEKTKEILEAFLPEKPHVLESINDVPGPLPDERRQQIARYVEQWFLFLSKQNPEKWKYGLICPYKGGL